MTHLDRCFLVIVWIPGLEGGTFTLFFVHCVLTWVPMLWVLFGFLGEPRGSSGFLGFPPGYLEFCRVPRKPDGSGRTRRTRTGVDDLRKTQTYPRGSYGFRMVLPDFRANSCGICIGGLESEDIRTFSSILIMN